MKSCGICDNCLSKKKVVISDDEFLHIEGRILSSTNVPVHSHDLVQHLHSIKKEKLWRVIEFLQAEKKIEVNESGMVKKIGK